MRFQAAPPCPASFSAPGDVDATYRMTCPTCGRRVRVHPITGMLSRHGYTMMETRKHHLAAQGDES